MNNVKTEEGYTMIVVLLAVAFLSSLSLVLVQYGRWQSQVSPVQRSLPKLQQARRMAAGWSRQFLKETLPDSPVITGTIEREWNLQPEITVNVTLESLNGKVNLNRFQRANTTEDFLNLVEALLEDMNYPNRVMMELARWILSEERSELPGGRYGGYDYSAPHREIYQVDEVTLISGFKEIGLTDEFRQTFTIYGSGDLNPLHFTPDQWTRFKRAMGNKVPDLPQAALQNRTTLRQYLQQEAVWENVSSKLRFLSRRDDSFRVRYRMNHKGTVKHAVSIFIFDYEDNSVNLKTRYSVVESSS